MRTKDSVGLGGKGRCWSWKGEGSVLCWLHLFLYLNPPKNIRVIAIQFDKKDCPLFYSLEMEKLLETLKVKHLSFYPC